MTKVKSYQWLTFTDHRRDVRYHQFLKIEFHMDRADNKW